MTFDFQCTHCPEIISVKSPIGIIPKTPMHCRHRMSRIWSAPAFSITWGTADYMNKAYDGDEKIPGLSTQEVRETVDMSGPVRA